MRTSLRQAVFYGCSAVLLSGAVACGGGPSEQQDKPSCDTTSLDCGAGGDETSYEPDPYDTTYEPDPYDTTYEPDPNDSTYEPDPYDTTYEPDPGTGCAYAGDPLCPDTPITLPPLDLGPWD